MPTVTGRLTSYRYRYLPNATSPDDVARRVASAARRLDVVAPDWHRRVDRATLDLWSTCDCVLGQVFGDYSIGLSVLFGRDHALDLDGDWTAFTTLVTREAWFVELDARAAGPGDDGDGGEESDKLATRRDDREYDRLVINREYARLVVGHVTITCAELVTA